jgi:hypothetical protein
MPESQALAIKKIVADVPAAELAAKAANLVVQADKTDRQEVAVTTVREIAAKRPATIVAVVGAIAKAAPDLSPVVAAEAAKLVAERAPEIAKAATAGAPAQADQIAAAVTKVSPKSAVKVTSAIVAVVPDQTTRVVDAVVSLVPSARPEIANTLSRMTERSASGSGGNGTIITLPGTISGKPAPNQPPSDAGTPTAGADSARKYGSPTP